MVRRRRLLLAFGLVCTGGAVLLEQAVAFTPVVPKKLTIKLGQEQPSQEAASRLRALWADLAGTDDVKVARALLALAATPKETVPFLKEHLSPVKADPKQVARLMVDLDSNQFALRQKAGAELEYLGQYVQADLKKALAGKPSAEVRRRILMLLDKVQVRPTEELKIKGAPNLGDEDDPVRFAKGPAATPAHAKPSRPPALWLRAVRAVVVLEHIATPEARHILRTMAGGEADALPTKEAKAALQRLTKKS